MILFVQWIVSCSLGKSARDVVNIVGGLNRPRHLASAVSLLHAPLPRATATA